MKKWYQNKRWDITLVVWMTLSREDFDDGDDVTLNYHAYRWLVYVHLALTYFYCYLRYKTERRCFLLHLLPHHQTAIMGWWSWSLSFVCTVPISLFLLACELLLASGWLCGSAFLWFVLPISLFLWIALRFCVNSAARLYTLKWQRLEQLKQATGKTWHWKSTVYCAIFVICSYDRRQK